MGVFDIRGERIIHDYWQVKWLGNTKKRKHQPATKMDFGVTTKNKDIDKKESTAKIRLVGFLRLAQLRIC